MTTAASAVNTLGIELLAHAAKPDQNALLSPYSIQSALAMTYAGADGVTRAEMAKVLHYPQDDAELHGSFAALRKALDWIARAGDSQAEQLEHWGTSDAPVTLTVANRLFGPAGYDFLEPFLTLLRDSYAAPFEALDFTNGAEGAAEHINSWVENQTRQRIRNLIPRGGLDEDTRLVLVNAVYFKAPWQHAFRECATRGQPFHVAGGQSVEVPMMTQQDSFGFARGRGFTAVVLPYGSGELQFLVLLPEQRDGLASLEQKLTPRLLADYANPPKRELKLHLPKFKLEPPPARLSRALLALGMRSAFDERSANFNRIATPGKHRLFIEEMFHKAFLDLDEKGTEAAAASAVMDCEGIHEPPEILEVRVDHPFLFAIQHRASGACLFLGRVVDPR